jgi:hypothetical protein
VIEEAIIESVSELDGELSTDVVFRNLTQIVTTVTVLNTELPGATTSSVSTSSVSTSSVATSSVSTSSSVSTTPSTKSISNSHANSLEILSNTIEGLEENKIAMRAEIALFGRKCGQRK